MDIKVKVLHRATLRGYTRLIIAYLLCLIILSTYQYIVLFSKGVIDQIFGISYVLAIVHHIGFSALVGLFLVGPFNVLENFKPQLGFNFCFVMLLILLSIESALIGYFTITYVPLGANILGYSFNDIISTVLKSGGFSGYAIIAFAFMAFVFYHLFKFTKTFYKYISKLFPFTFILLSLFLATLMTARKPINDNKTQYMFYNLIAAAFGNSSYESDIEYPLLKNTEHTDVLGDYFNLQEQKPNLVFVIVEGLGADFVGDKAEFGGFTPYIDGLLEKSLYWDNFLSNTGRNYGVIPSLLGSLPFGENGFMDVEDMPNKNTLFSILKNNGYRTSFYMGSNSSFNNMDNFLKSENIDYILDRSKFELAYELQPSDAAGASWGYPDKELYKKAFSVYNTEKQPKLDVFMTLTAHEPFIPPNEEYYENKVEEILVSKSKFNDRTKKIINNNKGVFGSLLYGDEALRDFMTTYKSKPEFNNTIFIITGDHRLVPVPQDNGLSRFHVPFMMYSPMLKSAKKISSVSSHFDVVPTLIAMLSKKYDIDVPLQTAWLGNGIDMNENFRINKNIALMRNKNELKDFISNEHFYSDGDMYTILDNLKLQESEIDDSSLNYLLNNFKSVNTYVTQQNKVIPNSLVIYKMKRENFSKAEMVWINSQFNGNDYDNAYNTARQLAFNKDFDKAILLLKFILSKVPTQIDAKILMGRANAWQGDYNEAELIFKECLVTNPSYHDTYCALLDVWYWSDNNEEVIGISKEIKKNNIDNAELNLKVERAFLQLKNKEEVVSTAKVNLKKEAELASAQ
ncbi:sulfatase-like hydrolase/transferase [Cellulophaga sp. HaHaR_3_176]|uniref:sulfatase-like hydrolase/transferase n=1 Tax=Cellulophaga sp. HaHaR_3_176 TaxID=1942464 RepID=UPI001C1F3264|nr:sulfatase-like hydrolase/transferase [Cellulophaga sp. HaHaR_3_176]QWX85310.1 sulfatase-like hydrolase/transferase [Cellulophaga sp. HaHaR_3_176]